MTIILLHTYYDKNHLDEVKSEMQQLGAPVIRAIWDQSVGMWVALEGCHRLRAARELGLEPIIENVGIYDESGYIDDAAMRELTINALTGSDNMVDDPEATVGDHLDTIGSGSRVSILDFDDLDD